MSIDQGYYAFIIQVTGVAERLENARILMENCGLEAILWPSVNIKKLPDSHVMQCIAAEPLFDPVCPYLLSEAEINQFLSHRQIWAEIIRRDLPGAMIFEDIAAVKPDQFYQALSLAVSAADDLGYIQFATKPVPDTRAVIDHAGESTLFHPLDTVPSCSAQFVTQDAARMLLAVSEIFDRSLPAFLQSHWYTQIRPGIIDPSGVLDVSDMLLGHAVQHNGDSLRDRYLSWNYHRALRSYARQKSNLYYDLETRH